MDGDGRVFFFSFLFLPLIQADLLNKASDLRDTVVCKSSHTSHALMLCLYENLTQFYGDEVFGWEGWFFCFVC